MKNSILMLMVTLVAIISSSCYYEPMDSRNPYVQQARPQNGYAQQVAPPGYYAQQQPRVQNPYAQQVRPQNPYAQSAPVRYAQPRMVSNVAPPQVSRPPTLVQPARQYKPATLIKPAVQYKTPAKVASGENRVRLVNGFAVAPAHAPLAVKRAVAAGNALQSRPYRMGGGHAVLDDTAFDCSGTVSYVLRHSGLMKGANSSSGFMSYGTSGAGKWITVYARNGHVFMTIGGLRLDARGKSRGAMGGPRWLDTSRSSKGFTARHPSGL